MSEEKTELHCADCKELITSGNFILVGEKNYHVEHFVCSHCKSQLAGKLYYDHEEKIYCEEDYHNICCPKCAKCSLPIKDKQFSDIIGKKYHETCFICHQCGSAFKTANILTKMIIPYVQNVIWPKRKNVQNAISISKMRALWNMKANLIIRNVIQFCA